MKSIEFIEAVVCKERLLNPEELHTKSRQQDLIEAKYLIIYYASHRGNSTSRCEQYFSLKHPMTNYVRKIIADRIAVEKKFRDEVERIARIIDENETDSMLCYWTKRLSEIKREISEITSEVERIAV